MRRKRKTEKLTELYNELEYMGAKLFTGKYDMDDGCDAFVVNSGERYGIFLDIDKIRTVQQEKEAVSHEWGHIVTGAMYAIDAPYIVRKKAEVKATRAQIRKVLSLEELRTAFQDGCRTSFDLSERFSLSEQFIEQALDYYKNACGVRF